MKILLGFEVGSGKEVYMTNAHTVVTGMTQLSGKTTCLEALVERGKVRAVAFLTKRGESGFRDQREIQPYFKEKKRGDLIDWQYVEAILEATMGEKMKLERSFIIDCCDGNPRKSIPPAKSLEEVYANFKKAQKDATRGFDQSIYTNLTAYFEIILPEIAKYDFADRLVLRKGFNVLNLIGMADEMQQLVIESVLSYVLKNLKDVVVVIPEAHKFIPQGLKTPVKGTALRFIKEGAALNNLMWLDSQETTSVAKALLKQCSNWIMGYQQERNEVANVRANIGEKLVSKEQIMSLELGHFIASLQKKIHHVYVLPSGIKKKLAKDVALGLLSPEVIKDMLDSMKIKEVKPAQEIEQREPEERPKEKEDIYTFKEWVGDPDELKKLRKKVWATMELVDSMKINHSEDLKEKDRIISDLERWEGIARKQGDALLMQQGLLSEAEAKLRGFEAFEGALMDFLVPRIEGILSMMNVTIDRESVEEMIDQKIAALPTKMKKRIKAVAGDTGIAWVDLWLPKLGSAEQKIIRFMAQKFPLKMTKSQVALGIGLTAKGGYFSGSWNNLKKNRLIVSTDNTGFTLAEGPP